MITIYKNRHAYVPEEDRFLGFENDHLVESRLFCVEDERLKEYVFKLDIAETGNIVDLVRIADETNALVLRLDVTQALLGEGGTLTAQLRAFDAAGTHVWHSECMRFSAGYSVHATEDASNEHVISEFEQLEVRAEATLAEAKEYAEQTEALYTEVKDTSTALTERMDTLSTPLTQHTTSTTNPHSVTAAQVGAYAKNEVYKKAETYSKDETDSAIQIAKTALTNSIPSKVSDLTNDVPYIPNTAIEHGAPDNESYVAIVARELMFKSTKQDMAQDDGSYKMHITFFNGIDMTENQITGLGFPLTLSSAVNLACLNEEIDAAKAYTDTTVETALGDIDTALDAILAIQAELTGGATA